jgi:rRNA maturation endonuclease Nob1
MEFKIECEECEETTYITADDSPEFCPMCGRRCIAEAQAAGEEDWIKDEYDE